MVQSLQLSSPQRHIKRVNRLPLLVAGTMALIVLAAIVVGLSSRGLGTRSDTGPEASSDGSASTFAENLKRGIVDGIIAEPVDATVSANPSTRPLADGPAPEMKTTSNAAAPEPATADRRNLENDGDWLDQLARERKEQLLRERHRQDMARLQARDAALDSPLTVAIAGVRDKNAGSDISDPEIPMSQQRGSDLYAKAMAEGFGADPNGQASKQAFFNTDIKELGYLPNGVLPAQSPFELKRGSVIPATLISGINSDLPGRISAQVSRPIFDSATGRHLLIPQGAKLFGRYDSEVAFGQSRVLAIWTDLIFPNGATLQLGGMAGTDATGYGGFKDKVDRHILRTFGSAALVALIGVGIDMSLPSDGRERDRDTASDSARRSFAETFGRVAERTIGKNLDVQPTLRIRPGYMFNVLVDQDIIFPGTYR
ncbi:IncP-type conjugal transfer protein TrbI (plasmid) [Ensifer adhaerens]|uniref:IncP-type conjugal transfer protein TrbI n=1 Tax=Ensifer adhaerens TaxID=106592 RepID=UPI0023A9E305|nr:IncP-type conjugal transfer protein TrbI [Ensifer adhaerens]WDZ81690.1 IncP-type conjugal transfer protein TrbI [Ensifer adhaerens]